MKHIFLSIVMACSLLACTHAVDRNANTQNPIMPIVYYSEDGTETIYLTDYLPQVVDFGTLTFSTQEGYEVVKVENDFNSVFRLTNTCYNHLRADAIRMFAISTNTCFCARSFKIKTLCVYGGSHVSCSFYCRIKIRHNFIKPN